jgi:putative transposase
MSLPRSIVPGTTYLVTRRCSQRQFLLRPSAVVNQIVLYCLAEASRRYDVLVHSFCVLSNHYHFVVTDVGACLPAFMHWFDEFVAKCVNASLGRWESLFAPGSYSAVQLEDEDAVLRKMAYAASNPVEAGLVMEGKDWPGLRSRPEDIGQTFDVERPEIFFREDGQMPDRSSLTLHRPPCFAELSDAEFAARLSEAVVARETELRDEARAEGRAFLGRQAVLDQSPFDCPRTFEPRREMKPRVATRDKWRRIEALQRLDEFLSSYRAAWLAFRDGIRDALFPFGTYAMRVYHGVQCAGP